MPGREDFAIIRSELLTDPRADLAAQLYTERNLATRDTALATVVGHVAMLGLWAMRETDDGVLPGDALSAMRFSIGATRDVLTAIRDALLDAKLLRKTRKGHYLVGFKACYEPIIRKRTIDAQRKRKARSSLEMSGGRPADIQRTSDGGPSVPDRTVPYRTEPERNEPPESIGCAPHSVGKNGKSARLSPKQWACVDGILDHLATDAEGAASGIQARNWRTLRAAGALSDDVGTSILDRWLKKLPQAAAKGKRKAGQE